MSKFIALCGRGTRENEFVTTARVGKDEVARILREEKNFRSHSFALPLKQVAQILFGMTDAQVWDDKLKEVIIPEWNMTPRKIFQLIGTEGGRLVFHPDMWGNIALNTWEEVKSGIAKPVVGVGEQTVFESAPKDMSDIRHIINVAAKLLFQVSDADAKYSSRNNTNITNWEFTFKDALLKLQTQTIPAILGLPPRKAWNRFCKIRKTLPTISIVGNGPYGLPPLHPAGLVIPDCRFENEAFLSRSIGGHVVHVCREIPADIKIVTGHASEQGVKVADGDHFIKNDSTLEALRGKVDVLLDELDNTQSMGMSY